MYFQGAHPRPGKPCLALWQLSYDSRIRKCLLLGDACGLADPLLGEGIYYAHKSAQLAAEAVIQSYHEPPEALKGYARHLNRVIISELRYARIGRQIIFSLPGAWPYRILTSLLKIMPKKCEETIQGQRSFKWFRPVGTNPRLSEKK